MKDEALLKLGSNPVPNGLPLILKFPYSKNKKLTRSRKAHRWIVRIGKNWAVENCERNMAHTLLVEFCNETIMKLNRVICRSTVTQGWWIIWHGARAIQTRYLLTKSSRRYCGDQTWPRSAVWLMIGPAILGLLVQNQGYHYHSPLCVMIWPINYINHNNSKEERKCRYIPWQKFLQGGTLRPALQVGAYSPHTNLTT